MPELRKDPIIGRWVIIATERARRPGNFVLTSDHQFSEKPEDCPFCHIKDTPLYYAANGRHANPGDWDTCIIPHVTPIVDTKGSFLRRGHGLYDVMEGYGQHEVVVESRKHVANMADLDEASIRLVFETYANRISELEKNPHFQYVLAYKNYGVTAGSRRIGHSRSHIIATPVNPRRVKDKLIGARKYFQYRERCVYCDLIRNELEFKERIILETEHFVAITPFAARFLFEVWILPKKHHCDFQKGLWGTQNDLAQLIKKLLTKMKIGLDDPAYNYIIHTAPFRRDHSHEKRWRTLDEDYHWHIEIFPRLTRVAGFEKGSGFYICAIPPEKMAEYLRKVEYV